MSANRNERLVPEGTRVVLLKHATQVAGVIRDVRRESYLKRYVIACDDGTVAYASPWDLSREDDAARTPLAPPPEY